jgi:ketosteroid isomerase-like protein
MSTVELVRRGYEALLRGDAEALRDFFAPDVKWHGGDPTASGACQNRHQVLQFIERARLGGKIGELVDVIEAGERVVVVMRPPGAGRDQLRANLTTVRDGKVVEMVAFETPTAALAAASS